MKNEPNIETAEAVPDIGRGTKCTIKQLKAEIEAGMTHMNLASPKGQGSGFGWGRGKSSRARMLHHYRESQRDVEA